MKTSYRQGGIVRRFLFVCCLISTAQLSGCSLLPDAIFGAFGEKYSGGGTTLDEKKVHFNRQLDTSPHPSPWND